MQRVDDKISETFYAKLAGRLCRGIRGLVRERAGNSLLRSNEHHII